MEALIIRQPHSGVRRVAEGEAPQVFRTVAEAFAISKREDASSGLMVWSSNLRADLQYFPFEIGQSAFQQDAVTGIVAALKLLDYALER
jgi:hypothetical protein